MVDFPQLSHLKTKSSPGVQRNAALGVISRLIGDRVTDFDVIVDASIGPNERDTFKVNCYELFLFSCININMCPILNKSEQKILARTELSGILLGIGLFSKIVFFIV